MFQCVVCMSRPLVQLNSMPYSRGLRTSARSSFHGKEKTPTGPVPYVIYRKIHCSVVDQGSVNISRTLMKNYFFKYRVGGKSLSIHQKILK
jgi:hypothetical protein